jgi:LuxR family maltose regulon positive regulatory protein
MGSELLWTKLSPPVPRAGLISRASLQSLLPAGPQGKLCLLSAPAGFGKTTLLAQWCAVAGAGRVAWVSLDEGDNDPTRFWLYVVEALRTVEPSMGTAALAALLRTGADLYRAVLPSLHSELSAVGSRLVLVLDDYHLITNATCQQTLAFFLDHLPAGVNVVLSTRADPPLPLARMRARGELAELRAADLQFTDEEASALLNGSMGLQLPTDDVERLTERTEGWAAALYLAGLSLRGREDASAFIASFQDDPGSLPALLEQANRDLGLASRRQIKAATPLTKRERAVLRQLPTRRSNREIGRELYVSVNTVRSQVQAIYRKLEVTSRAEAVAHARHLRLLPGSTPTDR